MAYTEEELKKELETKEYDLGLFDIKMPKMDGNELLSKVRASKIEKLKALDKRGLFFWRKF